MIKRISFLNLKHIGILIKIYVYFQTLLPLRRKGMSFHRQQNKKHTDEVI